MDKDKTEQLFKAAPTFFRAEELPWGFECGDGWYDLLLELAAVAEAVNRDKPETERCYAVQVKSKLGGLRCYVRRSDELLATAIDVAEERAGKTCEQCGAEGYRASVDDWVYVICRPCLDKLVAVSGRKRHVVWRGP